MKMKQWIIMAVVAGLVVLLAGTVSAGTPPGDPPGLARAIAAQEAHTDSLIGIAGVVGTAVGSGANGAVVFVFTEEPGVVGIPGALDGVPVVAQATGRIDALQHRTGHNGGPGGGGNPTPTPTPGGDPVSDCSTTDRCPRPVPIGVSTRHPSITAGTIGARVTDGANVYALSNNHVYADVNAAVIGDPVLQPGTFDGGGAGDEIGTLAAFVPVLLDPDPTDTVNGPANVVDAAIALSSTTNLGNSTPSNGYGTPKSTTAAAAIKAKVQKYGRTTEQTKGQVWAINASVNVCYNSDCTDVAYFVNQIVVRDQGRNGFSQGGDSGSLVLRSARNSVGLLFAGGGQFTFVNPIDAVLGALGVTIDGE